MEEENDNYIFTYLSLESENHSPRNKCPYFEALYWEPISFCESHVQRSRRVWKPLCPPAAMSVLDVGSEWQFRKEEGHLIWHF